MALASQSEIEEFLSENTGWELAGKEITRTFQFDDFVGSMSFITKVGLLAEAADHHPDIDIRWNKVTLTLSTHSEGGLTDKDFSLATRL